jgi:hypothetical protein
MVRTFLLVSALLPVLLAASPREAAAQGARSWFRDQGYAAPQGARIVACHGYGCSRRLEMAVNDALMRRVGAILKAGQGSADSERRALGNAVRAYTAYLAASFGGEPDEPGSPPGMSGSHGQMDCVDEAANTTSLLLMLQEKGYLAHHRVERPQSRGFFIDGRYPHVTAIIAEKRSGREWAVDPWKKAPGGFPDILPLEQWRQES